MRRLRGLGRAFLRSYDKQRVSAVRVCGPKVGAEAACAEQKAVEALDVSFYALKEGGGRGSRGEHGRIRYAILPIVAPRRWLPL